MPNNKEYGADLQKLFLEIMISDAQCYVRVQNIYNSINFAKQLQPTAEYIQKYSEEYKELPSPAQIEANTGIKLHAVENITDNMVEWFLDEFEGFTKHNTLNRVIINAADLIDKGEYDPIEKMIKDAVQISLTRNLGLDYFADPRARLERLRNSNGQMSTGWPTLDRKLFGGFNRGELEIFAGGSGCVTEDTLVEVIELPIIIEN
jgi:hypothetical protein